MASAPARYGTPLSRNEIDVLRLVADGHSNAAIAKRLFKSEDTVKTHLRSAYRKLGATNRAHAAGLAAVAGHVHRTDIHPSPRP